MTLDEVDRLWKPGRIPKGWKRDPNYGAIVEPPHIRAKNGRLRHWCYHCKEWVKGQNTWEGGDSKCGSCRKYLAGAITFGR